MIPLLFILIVTGFSILISCHFSPEITRPTCYIGAAIGLFASGIALDFWNGRNRRYEKGEGIPNLLTSNICSGGAYFHTTQPLPEGSRVKVDLDLPLDRLERLKEGYRQAYIKVTGKDLRAESEGMAICLDEDYQIMGTAK